MSPSTIEAGFETLLRRVVREELHNHHNGASKTNGAAKHATNGAAKHTNGASNGAIAAPAVAKAAPKVAAKAEPKAVKASTVKAPKGPWTGSKSEFIRAMDGASVKEVKAAAAAAGLELTDGLIYNIRSSDKKKKEGGVEVAPKAAKAAAPKVAAAKPAKAVAPKAAKAAAKPAKETKAAAPKAEAGDTSKVLGDITKVMGTTSMSPAEVLGALKGAGKTPSASDPLKYIGYLLSTNVGKLFERKGKEYFVLKGGAAKAEAPKATKAAKETKAAAPKAAKAASAKAAPVAKETGRGDKSAFIRARPNDKPADIVAAAAKEGITLTVGLIYNIRSSDKKAQEGGAKAKGKTSGKAERVASKSAESVEAKVSEDSAAGDPQTDTAESLTLNDVLSAAAEPEAPASVPAAPEPPVVKNGSNGKSVLEDLGGLDLKNPFGD